MKAMSAFVAAARSSRRYQKSRVVGFGFWVLASGFLVLGFWVLGFWVLGSGFWVLGVLGFGFWVLGSGFWVLGCGLWVWVLGFGFELVSGSANGLEEIGLGLG
jgi:hypothetical protein